MNKQVSLEKVGKASTFQVSMKLHWLRFAGEKTFLHPPFSAAFPQRRRTSLWLSQYLQSKICPFMVFYLCAAHSPSEQPWKASKYYSPYCKHKETMLK